MKQTLHVQLEQFEGPLDLLLHLIERDELDIYDIPIGQVTEQYLAYLADLDKIDVDQAGEFLVMAATLCQIKARMLLPAPVASEEPSLVPGLEPGDPREELVFRLLEYSRFKQASTLFAQLAAEQADVFGRWQEGMEPDLPANESIAGATTLADLFVAWEKMLIRRRPAPVREIEPEEVTVSECIAHIRMALQQNAQGLTFQRLFPETAHTATLVATFLALLELWRLGEIVAWQEQPFGDIYILAWGEQISS